MINLFIAYDEKDQKIGEYCEFCKTKLNDYVSSNSNIKVHNLETRKCNHAYISTVLAGKLSNAIFVAYSHGSEKQLLCNGSAYIDSHNTNLFKYSMVYAMACSTGAKLGNTLIQNGCKTFIGFDKEVVFINDYKEILERCENWAITRFLLEDIDIESAFNDMKEEFNKQINKIGFFDASWLIGNRDALVLLGNKDLTLKDFASTQ